MTIQWKQVLPALVVGVLLGVGLSFGALRRFHRRGWDFEGRSHRMLERFSRELDLTPDQKQKVGAILEEKRRGMQSLWDEGRKKFDALRDSTGTEIRSLLTPAQREKFDEMRARMEKKRKKWESPAGER